MGGLLIPSSFVGLVSFTVAFSHEPAKELHVSWRFPNTASPFSLTAITPVQSIHSLGQRTGLVGKVHQKVLIGTKAAGTTGGYPGHVPSLFIGIIAL